MAETKRVTWTDPREPDGEAIVALIRASSYGATPVMVPASNGIKEGGVLQFTDWKGEVVRAEIGDDIEVTDEGWVLHRHHPTDEEDAGE